MFTSCQDKLWYKSHLISIFWVWLISSSLAIAAGEYLLGDGDTVGVTVYEHPDLTLEARISPEGTIPYPLLEEVTIGGLTTKAAGRKIARMLEDRGFIISPQVAVSVKNYTSQQIHILGKVNNPGNYPLEGESTVVDLLARAGGVTEEAADVIFVVENSAGGKSVKHEIDLLRFYAGEMDQNIQVSRGDTILVPKMDTFYIHGEVKRPGEYRLLRGMTVVQALSVGGGVSDRGSLKRMMVTRNLANGKTEKIDVKLSDTLEPNDVLFVKERYF
jgi:polysaccharide export outer membrane protein